MNEKEKQIEEMAKVCTDKCKECHNEECRKSTQSQHCIAENLYNAGYRKQSVGEWKIKAESYRMISDDFDEELYVECPFCGRTFWVPYEFDDQKTFEYAREHYPYCHCGAKMGGGEE